MRRISIEVGMFRASNHDTLTVLLASCYGQPHYERRRVQDWSAFAAAMIFTMSCAVMNSQAKLSRYFAKTIDLETSCPCFEASGHGAEESEAVLSGIMRMQGLCNVSFLLFFLFGSHDHDYHLFPSLTP